MSNFIEPTYHPIKKKMLYAYWIDDYFGKHKYGIKFVNEDRVFSEKELDEIKNKLDLPDSSDDQLET